MGCARYIKDESVKIHGERQTFASHTYRTVGAVLERAYVYQKKCLIVIFVSMHHTWVSIRD